MTTALDCLVDQTNSHFCIPKIKDLINHKLPKPLLLVEITVEAIFVVHRFCVFIMPVRLSFNFTKTFKIVRT